MEWNGLLSPLTYLHRNPPCSQMTPWELTFLYKEALDPLGASGVGTNKNKNKKKALCKRDDDYLL